MPAGSGESEIRRWIIENDWLDAVVALPDQLFYNTGISTYFWIVTNRKRPERRGTVQLIDARDLFVKMRKSLGEKRKEISAEQIAEITRLYSDHVEGDRVKVFPNEAFGFLRITVERPLRVRWEINDDTIAAALAAKGVQKLGDDDRDALAKLLEANRGLACDTAREMTAALRQRRDPHRPAGQGPDRRADGARPRRRSAGRPLRRPAARPGPARPGERAAAVGAGHLRSRRDRSDRHHRPTAPPSTSTSRPR